MPADGNPLAGLGERESGRAELADGNRPATSEVNNKLRQLMLCSSKSASTSLLSVQRSLSTRLGGPWGRCRRTSSRSYGRCGTSAVSCARSGGTRMGSVRIPLSGYKFCDARSTHVQVQVFLLWCKQALEPYPKTTCTRPTAGVQEYL